MKDTYENRMLFVTMWFGAPTYDTAKMFPEWFDVYMSASIGEASNSWLKDFCKVALKMRCHRD